MTNELRTTMRLLAELRRDVNAAADAVARARELVASTPEGEMLAAAEARRSELGRLVDETDRLARELTLKAYRASGDKKPAEGASVKVYERKERRVTYDSTELGDWLREHAPVLLAPDRMAVEAAAESLAEKGAPLIVNIEVQVEARPNIAKDLSGYLEPDDEEAEKIEEAIAESYIRDEGMSHLASLASEGPTF